MTVDIRGLIAVLDAATKEPNFNMASWKCGSSHCMIGAFCDQNPDDLLHLSKVFGRWAAVVPRINIQGSVYENIEAVSIRFGITAAETQWLFTESPDNLRYCSVSPLTGMRINYERAEYATYLQKPEALNRLRKFICYKMTKQLLTLEHARQVDGNKAVVVASQYAKDFNQPEQENN